MVAEAIVRCISAVSCSVKTHNILWTLSLISQDAMHTGQGLVSNDHAPSHELSNGANQSAAARSDAGHFQPDHAPAAVASEIRAQLKALTKSCSRKLFVLSSWSEGKAFARLRVTIERVMAYPLVRQKNQKGRAPACEDGRGPDPARINLL